MSFAPIEPFKTGYLQVSDGNLIYWEASGNSCGVPVLYLHGGPGGGIGGGYRRHFDPEKFLIVSFEQRGCGRSRPLATEAEANLSSNTTQKLIQDIEALRQHLQIKRWLLYGASWGTTLALAYAQTHPPQISGLILAAVTTTTAQEVDWITVQMRHIFPREWDRFAEAVVKKPDERLVDAYYRAITDPDEEIRFQTAKAWCAWEDVHVSLDPHFAPNPRYQDPGFRLLFATLVIHYWKHSAFIPEQEILRNIPRIAHLPCILIHGKLDVSSPLEIPWRLHLAWPGSELIICGEGHGGATMAQEVTRAAAKMLIKIVQP
jgi:proline iminopeptidase